MMKYFSVVLFFFSFLNIATAQTIKKFDESKLQIKWQLIENNYQKRSRTISSFTFINHSKASFPKSGWTIYFNSCRDIDSAKATNGVMINHVNGDIYQIKPGNDFKSIAPKDSIVINYFSNELLINYTAAPSGMYIVWDANPENGFPLSNFSLGKLINTTTGIVTAEKIYHQNSIIKNIPEIQLPKILPTPYFYHKTNGECLITIDTKIIADDFFSNEKKYFTQDLNSLFSKSKNKSTAQSSNVIISFKKAVMKEEAYKLSVTQNNIIITASTGAGIFYGIQSLKELMAATVWEGSNNSISIPCVEVEDEPRFGYRSLLLDVARNFKPKKDIFRILDLMALYKLNVFHFHFCDDEGWRLEIPSLPELTTIGSKRGHTLDSKKLLPASYGAGPVAGNSLGTGYYTRNDFIEILKYANERHIQVIPEIESPGHSRAAIKAMDARYEKYISLGDSLEANRYLLRDINDASVYISAQQWTDNVMCVALPSVYTFFDKVIDELVIMYNEAGAPLETIHLGGDEVPSGAWEKSPVCLKLVKDNKELNEINDLWYYYYEKLNQLLISKNLMLSGWEEVGMRKTILDGSKTMIVNSAFANKNMQLHVWNNMVGWGTEDLPYKLANAGYRVVLSPVSNNYFDLSYYKSPDEPGYYWGGFVDIDKPFYFIPYDYYKTTKEDAAGDAVNASVFNYKERLTDFGKKNIVGLQGLMWAENQRSTAQMEYLLLPKLLGLAERAWTKDPEWATEKDSVLFTQKYNEAWSVFVNQVGKELPKLDRIFGGFQYRIPAAGVLVKDGKVFANVQFPGLQIRYTTDGTLPTQNSSLYTEPIIDNGKIKISVFDTKGRSSRAN